MKNKILKAITALSVFGIFYGGLGICDYGIIPIIIYIISVCWLSLFLYANREILDIL